MHYRNGGQILVEVLRRAGVGTVFGVVSVHNLPLVEAVDAELRFVPVRHEAAAVNAADGYARARGGLGCALTSTGTGAGNAAGSMIEALTAGSPVLHVTSTIPTEHLGRGRGFIHEFVAQPEMLSAVSSSAWHIRRATEAPGVLVDAISEALSSPTGPASVEWPIDLQYASGDMDLPGTIPVGSRRPPQADHVALAEAAALLASSARPAVWAGGGAVRYGAQLAELVERLGAALFTSNAGRGAVPEDHHLCVGNYASSEEGQALLADADVLLSVGTHFRSNETRTYKLVLPDRHVQVDIDAKAIGRSYPALVGLHGDAGDVLGTLSQMLPACEPGRAWTERVEQARVAARAAQREAIGSYSLVCDAIRSALPRGAIVARDVTIPSSSWGNRLLEMYDPRSNIFARGGGIGQGLAMGIGAALGRPDVPTVVMAGDGGLAVHLGELLTLAQEQARVCLIVFNDRGYGVLRNAQLARNAKPSGVDLHTPDFRLLAEAVGLGYARVERASDAAGAVAAAVGGPVPTLVEVDVDLVDPMPTPFTPPVEVPEEQL